MKKSYSFVLLFAVFLSAGSLWAGTGFLENQSYFSNRDLRTSKMLSSKKTFGEGGGSFSEGKFCISAGYGWPNLGKSVVNALISDTVNDVKATGMGPLHFRAEYALSDGVGFGVSVNYISFGVKYTDEVYQYKLSRSSLSILARINFHFGTTEQLDPYFGVGAGYRQATWEWTSTDPNFVEGTIPGYTPFGFETTVGVRYYFVEGFGVYTEIGIAKSVIQAGLIASF